MSAIVEARAKEAKSRLVMVVHPKSSKVFCIIAIHACGTVSFFEKALLMKVIHDEGTTLFE